MSALTGIIAGIALTAGGLALKRYIDHKRGQWQSFKENLKSTTTTQAPVMDFEKDPDTGTYRLHEPR